MVKGKNTVRMCELEITVDYENRDLVITHNSMGVPYKMHFDTCFASERAALYSLSHLCTKQWVRRMHFAEITRTIVEIRQFMTK